MEGLMDFIGFILNHPETGRKQKKETEQDRISHAESGAVCPKNISAFVYFDGNKVNAS